MTEAASPYSSRFGPSCARCWAPLADEAVEGLRARLAGLALVCVAAAPSSRCSSTRSCRRSCQRRRRRSNSAVRRGPRCSSSCSSSPCGAPSSSRSRFSSRTRTGSIRRPAQLARSMGSSPASNGPSSSSRAAPEADDAALALPRRREGRPSPRARPARCGRRRGDRRFDLRRRRRGRGARARSGADVGQPVLRAGVRAPAPRHGALDPFGRRLAPVRRRARSRDHAAHARGRDREPHRRAVWGCPAGARRRVGPGSADRSVAGGRRARTGGDRRPDVGPGRAVAAAARRDGTPPAGRRAASGSPTRSFRPWPTTRFCSSAARTSTARSPRPSSAARRPRSAITCCSSTTGRARAT